MRLDNLHIDNFGKLSDFSMEFKEGYNRIYGENEFGKTTIMAFIKMMFYGSSDCTVRDMYKNPRKKYAPVSLKAMGGQIEFTSGNVKYRLERTFGQSLSGDKISAYKLSDGTSVRLPAKQEPGVFFFGMGVSAFEKSIFIGQLGNNVSGSDKDDEISSKLSSLASGGDENVSAQKATAILLKEREVYFSKGGSKGVCDKLNREITLLRDSLASAKRAELELSARAEERMRLEEQINVCEQRCKELDRINRAAASAEKLKKLDEKLVMIKKLEAVREEEKIIQSKLCNGDFTADATFAEDIERVLNESERLPVRKKEIENQLASIKESTDESTDSIKANLDDRSAVTAQTRLDIAACEKYKSDAEARLTEAQTALSHAQGVTAANSAKSGSSVCVSAVVCGIICACAAIAFAVFGFITAPLFFIPCGVSAVIGIAGVILLCKRHGKAQQTASSDASAEGSNAVSQAEDALTKAQLELNECSRKLHDMNDKLSSAISEENELKIKYEALLLSIKSKDEMAAKITASLKEADDDIAASEKRILSAFAAYKSVESIALLRQELSSLRMLLERLNTLKAQEAGQTELIGENTDAHALRSEIEAMRNSPELASLEECDFSASAEEYNRLFSSELPSLKAELVRFDSDTKQRFGECRGVSGIEEEIRLKSAELDSISEYVSLLDIAADTINEADSELRMNFGPELNDRAKKLMQELTGVGYDAFTVSKSLDVSVRSTSGATVPWQLLSSGTVDQTYLALRIAVAQLLCSSGESFPLLLDDVLLQYDNARCAKAEQFLSSLGESMQIIHFTCRK